MNTFNLCIYTAIHSFPCQQAYSHPQQTQAYPQPPPYMYQPPVQAPPVQSTVVVTQPVVTVNTQTFRDYPVTVTDSNGQQVQTVLQYKAGLLTYLVAALICLFLSEIGLCWLAIIPFFIRELKDVYHITPTDGRVVGIYKRLS
ncbi:Lipopolysaccharide-induced tumor necrosis factor-alpha factor homolog [Geodia barretti]|uniref:Lipopolysaccharide-induced tumor necrosis factor-alpha factor homolog n=1 Tax=Geodia barretti TaxID=519541 RepID=A0AA35XJ53_GEOBA|nr:Lipopolysaccharide-induced tumor necrosis factor-alpha factor homolog [Geodia barretti]